ncbi:MAG: hypothetical protein HY225_00555 [Candidatus Vogelbacteria bacterium]|nr:hypothetical protein [Candidatus Vogelbacteria bacterium]
MKFNFEQPKNPNDYEINDRNLPLQEIVPDVGPEEKKYEKIIINGILKDIKKRENGEDLIQKKKDRKKKPN